MLLGVLVVAEGVEDKERAEPTGVRSDDFNLPLPSDALPPSSEVADRTEESFFMECL